MKNLGMTEDERYGYPCCEPVSSKSKKKRIIFPSVTLFNGQVDDAGLDGCEVGDKYKVTFEVVVRSVQQRTDQGDKIKKEISLDLTGVDKAVDDGEADEDGDGKDDAAEEARAKAKKGPKPTESNDDDTETVSAKDSGLVDDAD